MVRMRPGDQKLPVVSVKSVPVTPVIIDHLRLKNAAYYKPLIDIFIARRELGIERYGSELHTFNGRDTVQDFIDEMVDGIHYAQTLFLEALATGDRDGMTLWRRNIDALINLVAPVARGRAEADKKAEEALHANKSLLKEIQEARARRASKPANPPTSESGVSPSEDGRR